MQNAAVIHQPHRHERTEREPEQRQRSGGRRVDSYFQHIAVSTPQVSNVAMVTADYHLLHNWGCALKPCWIQSWTVQVLFLGVPNGPGGPDCANFTLLNI